ncbi:MAG: RagB/SusD family nutrient uptake outer membrane protein [Bacteroides sp.]|nr:RagB/SusD family nutrient uptake outer membrane protein [Bacteroides sp.]
MKKNIFYYSMVLAAAACLNTGCSGFLDEETNGKVFDNVLTTQNGLESALVGAYRGWQACWSYGFTNGWATEMTLGGDDLTCPPGTGNTQEYDRYDVKDSNSSAPTVFQGCYKAIQGANNIIENYQNCQGNQTVIDHIVGEAYFIRAYSYYWLVRCHGKLPLVTSAVFNMENLNMEVSSVEDIYKQIESDLKAAIGLLSNDRRNDEPGRPNIGAAKAVLAEVYLSWAGWPLKDTSKYAEAATYAEDVIKNRTTYGFDYEDSYDILFENRDDSGVNKEDIFSIPCNLSAGSSLNAMNGYWAYPGEIGGWDVVFAELTFFNEFPEGVRKDATFALNFTSEDGTQTWHWTELKNPRPYYKKLMKNENDPLYYNYASQIPMRMLRLSQTALTYAEAKARSGGPDDLAYECINKIRTRAGLEEYSGLSAADFADKCVDERAWELCGERVRWFDMVRLEIVEDVIAKKDPKDNQPLHAVTKADYTFPIPSHDALLNKNLNADR